MSQESNASISFHVSGMHCAICAANIQRALEKKPGVIEAAVNYGNEQAMCKFDAGEIYPKEIRETVDAMGYKAHMETEESVDLAENERTEELKLLKKQLIIGGFLSFWLLLGMLPGEANIFKNSWLMWLLATPVQFWLGKRFYQGAWSALKNMTARMGNLIALGTSVAYFYSIFV